MTRRHRYQIKLNSNLWHHWQPGPLKHAPVMQKMLSVEPYAFRQLTQASTSRTLTAIIHSGHKCSTTQTWTLNHQVLQQHTWLFSVCTWAHKTTGHAMRRLTGCKHCNGLYPRAPTTSPAATPLPHPRSNTRCAHPDSAHMHTLHYCLKECTPCKTCTMHIALHHVHGSSCPCIWLRARVHTCMPCLDQLGRT